MKTCLAPHCISPVFSHGFCQRHGYLRTDKKVKKDFPKIKITTVRDNIQTSFGFTDQLTLFGTLWENSKDEKGYVICKFTGQRLNRFLMSDLWYNCFAHILSKKRYPWFKLNPANVCIVHPEFHRIVDAGTQKERAEHSTWKFEEWDTRVIKMKEEYVRFKKENLLA